MIPHSNTLFYYHFRTKKTKHNLLRRSRSKDTLLDSVLVVGDVVKPSQKGRESGTTSTDKEDNPIKRSGIVDTGVVSGAVHSLGRRGGQHLLRVSSSGAVRERNLGRVNVDGMDRGERGDSVGEVGGVSNFQLFQREFSLTGSFPVGVPVRVINLDGVEGGFSNVVDNDGDLSGFLAMRVLVSKYFLTRALPEAEEKRTHKARRAKRVDFIFDQKEKEQREREQQEIEHQQQPIIPDGENTEIVSPMGEEKDEGQKREEEEKIEEEEKTKEEEKAEEVVEKTEEASKESEESGKTEEKSQDVIEENEEKTQEVGEVSEKPEEKSEEVTEKIEEVSEKTEEVSEKTEEVTEKIEEVSEKTEEVEQVSEKEEVGVEVTGEVEVEEKSEEKVEQVMLMGDEDISGGEEEKEKEEKEKEEK
eukprot:CAMPEP_0201518162 /NCGR_PEP_ID=MMETSP0161_2-20130828/9069_1 /ASSEMBLY_ACC=CAM_ASM_000251 /TAXON_ID=180227 /ORGANISM="Neoparamoeba aestuarina, Strain SoJaBio B1-5/56/2" /LENGTH=416 /DNA_ID=CAMNT_0047915851 /DNA_START=205 /DNA_END=1453 /DNA_ORIENTATION=+